MKKKRGVFNVELDKEEKVLLKSVERGEWKTVGNVEEEAAFAKEAAANSLLGNNDAKNCKKSQG